MAKWIWCHTDGTVCTGNNVMRIMVGEKPTKPPDIGCAVGTKSEWKELRGATSWKLESVAGGLESLGDFAADVSGPDPTLISNKSTVVTTQVNIPVADVPALVLRVVPDGRFSHVAVQGEVFQMTFVHIDETKPPARERAAQLEEAAE